MTANKIILDPVAIHNTRASSKHSSWHTERGEGIELGRGEGIVKERGGGGID